MSFGPITVYTATIASAASTSGAFDLTKAYANVWLDVPSLSTNAELVVFGSSDGSTYRVVFERVNTAPVQYQTMIVNSASNNKIVPLNIGLRYFKLAATGTVTDGATLKVICSD